MTPDFRISANSQDITAQIKDRLLSLRLTDEAGFKTDDVEIVLDDRDSAISLPNTGAELDVALGYQETGLLRMGLYVVDEIELSGPPDKLIIRAKAAAFVRGKKYGSLQTQKTRAWDSKTLGDIVRTVAAEHGYRPVVAEQLNSLALPYIEQTAESDLNLLVRLAQENGAIIKPMESRLCCVLKGIAERADGSDMPQLSFGPGDVGDWRVSLIDRKRFTSVKAKWHDQSKAQTFTLTAGEGEPIYEINHVYAGKQAARNAAESRLSKYQRGSSTMSLTLPGNTEASAERKINLSGFRQGVNGQWICRQVDHELNDSGFTTKIEADAVKKK